MQNLRRWVRKWFGANTIEDVAALEIFIAERAAFIAQKCAITYCRGKTGLSSHALFEEKEFIDALTVCRWESFVAVLGDLLIALENHLRLTTPKAGHDAAAQQIAALFGHVLGSVKLPDYRADGWAKDIEAFRGRFAIACRQPTKPLPQIFQYSAQRLFDTLPIHERMRRLDTEVVFGAVRFHGVGVFEELTSRARFDAILRNWQGVAWMGVA